MCVRCRRPRLAGPGRPGHDLQRHRRQFLVAQIAIPADATGPNAYYRLRNTADTDATIRLETVYTIEGGDTYRAFAVVTVPAGEEVTVRYRIVAFDALTDAEERKVRSGEADFVVVLNGEERPDV